MSRWSRFLHDASRSRRFLWRFALALLSAGLLTGYGLHRWGATPAHSLQAEVLAATAAHERFQQPVRDADELSSAVVEVVNRRLRERAWPFEAVLDFLPSFALWARTAPPEALSSVVQERFGGTAAAIARDLVAVLRKDDGEARSRLEALASNDPPARYAAHALGAAALADGEFHEAFRQFRREGVHADADRSRRLAVECLVTAEDYDALRALNVHPEYARHITPAIELRAAVHTRDWRTILHAVPRSQLVVGDWGVLVLTVLTGAAWSFFLFHLGQVAQLGRASLVACGLALGAGALSTTVTIYAVIWQDEMLGLSPEGDILRSAAYFVGAVGVREETGKLLLFLPFLPWLARRGGEREALVVASFVGLGFAVEENSSYFLDAGGTTVAGRFLTANFLHVALTGLNGLALYRAVAREPGGWAEFLTVFGGTIIAHGVYDTLLMLPDAALGGYLALAVFVLTCRAYFVRAHAVREPLRATISLTGSFVLGVATLAAAMIAFQVARLGPADGLSVVLPELIGTIVLLVMFFREFDEQLAA